MNAFGRAVWDWITEEPVPGGVRLQCWGCGETETFRRVGKTHPGYIPFFRDHRPCMEVATDARPREKVARH